MGKLKYLEFLRKRMNTKPSRGPYHFRAPSKILWRTIRGMLPHKLARGKEALDRLKVFRLKQRRKFCTVGRLSHEMGWKYQRVVGTLEARRKVKSSQFHKRHVADQKLKDKAREIAIKKAAPEQAIIESFGFR